VTTQAYEHSFVTHLETLREDRAALAKLRRGLGKKPGQAPEMFPFVIPFVHQTKGSWQEEVHYMVASLFGFHPESTTEGNMGKHFAQLRNQMPDATATERRFTALLAAHPEELDVYLRQAVGLLKSKEIPINWHRLMWDILSWNDPEKRVRVHKWWAGEFWG
jgi:CRISPR system Cascade subunit CasB